MKHILVVTVVIWSFWDNVNNHKVKVVVTVMVWNKVK